jgi:hypothetical protein
VPTQLPKELVALMRGPSPCFISTTMPDGSSQLTQTWVDTDGEHILINTVEGFQKVKNMRCDPASRWLCQTRASPVPTPVDLTFDI